MLMMMMMMMMRDRRARLRRPRRSRKLAAVADHDSADRCYYLNPSLEMGVSEALRGLDLS
jgi:hypothetical protein